MSSDERSRFLVLLLRPQLGMLVQPEEPGGAIDLQGDRYFAHANSGIPGFYDWLRSAAGEVIGVRYAAVESETRLINAVRGLPYVRLADDETSVSIFFSSNQLADDDKSADQAFGGSGVFENRAGTFALSFETYALTHDELNDLVRHSTASQAP